MDVTVITVLLSLYSTAVDGVSSETALDSTAVDRVSLETALDSTAVDRLALETALEKERMMLLCIAQCMTVGAPQTGKSFLKRRLLKQTG